jgi:hypothetical protein
MKNVTIPHGRLECGAKTRQGTPCMRDVTPGRTRCNLHGGKSPRGKDHPRYIHGYYSKDEKEARQQIQKLIRDMKRFM